MSLNHWRVLVTRPEAEAQALVTQLAAQQVFASALPLLAINALPLVSSGQQMLNNLDQYCAVIVVSKPAARLVINVLPDTARAGLCVNWFSVGAATAAVLAQSGIATQYPVEGDDSEALLRLAAFQEKLTRPGKVLIVRGSEGRDWLASQLQARGIQVDFLALYERYLPHYPAGTLLAKVQSEALNGLVVSSGQGLKNLIELAQDKWGELARLPLFVPSQRVAELAREQGAHCVINCQGANADALIKALAIHQPAYAN